MKLPSEKINIKKCSRCGGKCCRIYLRHSDGGTMPNDIGFEEWLCGWEEEFEINCCSILPIKPLFDPCEVHASGNEHLIRDLVNRGIDPNSCKFRGKNGCLLPRRNRPKVCREYMC